MIKPDIIADVKFYTTQQGGRIYPTPSEYFGCIFEVHGSNHDARLLLSEVGAIEPGEIKKAVPIKFLCADLVIPKIEPGNVLYLSEGNLIGEATVIRILNTNPESTDFFNN